LELDCNYIADILKTRATRQFKERWNNKQVLSILEDDFTQNKDSFLIQLIHKKID
jgi:hypothetical protein